jgi:hypothetical protein
MAKKRKKPTITPEERERFACTMRMLEERIAYHEKRLAEREAQRESS